MIPHRAGRVRVAGVAQRVMVVDGNSLVHRSFHALAGTGARDGSGAPIWAVRGLMTQLVAAADRIGPTRIVVGFDDPTHNRRKRRWPSYKAQREEKLPTLVSQLESAAEFLGRVGVHVVTPDGWEADDVLASTARTVAEDGGTSVLVTSDRDAFALIDESTSVLRVISGGVEGSPMLTPDRLVTLTGVRPEQYLDFAALRGDPSDNLPGVDGIGPKRAAALLTAFGDATALFAEVAAGGDRVKQIVGPAVLARLQDRQALEHWQHNRAVMRPETGLPLGLDAGTGVLPYEAEVLRHLLNELGLPGTAAAARRVLAHVVVDDPEPTMDTLGWDSRHEWRSRPTMPKLPVDLQPTLF